MRMIGFISPTLRHLEASLLASKVIDFIGVRSAAELKEKVAGAEAALIGNSAYDSGAAQTLRSAQLTTPANGKAIANHTNALKAKIANE